MLIPSTPVVLFVTAVLAILLALGSWEPWLTIREPCVHGSGNRQTLVKQAHCKRLLKGQTAMVPIGSWWLIPPFENL